MNKKNKKAFSHYPTDDLVERGNKVENSNLYENIVVWIVFALIFGGAAWFWWWVS